MPDKKTNLALSWALFYEGLGWSVIPAHVVVTEADGRKRCSCNDGFDCISQGKHPALAWAKYQKTRATREEITRWFGGNFRGYGVGLITGTVSGMFVVDVDCAPGKPGPDTLHDLQVANDDLPDTPMARTGGGGQHYIFRLPPDVKISTDKNTLGPGVDTRGEGGFIIAAPSLHASGNYYLWDEHAHPSKVKPAEAPAWLIEMAREDGARSQKHSGQAMGQATEDWLGRIGDKRESYMVSVIAGCIRTYHHGTGALPDEDEVYGEAWPTYSRKVKPRDGKTLEEEGRGETLMRSRIRHMLRRAASGAWPVIRDLEEKIAAAQEAKAKEQAEAKAQAEGDGAEGAEAAADGATAGADGGAGPRYPLPALWYRDTEANLDVSDFVEDLLTSGAMSVVYGESNCGKTFFLTDLAMHVAAGVAWRGKAVEQGAVIYVALEGGHGIKNRIAAFKQHHKDIPADIPFIVVPSSINMRDPEADTPKLIETIQAIAAEVAPIPVRMVVIDTVSRALAGGNENSSEDMGAMVINTDYVRRATGVHICLIHHSGKNAANGARGHSLLRAATDTEIEVTRDHNSGLSVATATKQREMEMGGEYGFTLQSVELGANRRGKKVTSCIVVAAEAPKGKKGYRLKDGSPEAVVLAHFRTYQSTLKDQRMKVPMEGMTPQLVGSLDGFRRYLQNNNTYGKTMTGPERVAWHRATSRLVAHGYVSINGDDIWAIKSKV